MYQTHQIRLSYTQEDHLRFRIVFHILYTSETSLLNKKTGEFKFVDQPEFNQFGYKETDNPILVRVKLKSE
jgi:hypothetical protein